MLQKLNHGCIRSPEDSRDFKLGAILGGESPKGRVDFRDLCVPQDQKWTSSCVGQTVAQQARLRALLCGTDIGLPSSQAIYIAARVLDMPRDPLADVGCTFRNAYRACGLLGMVSADRIPFDPATINEPLPWDVARAGVNGRIVQGRSVGYWRAQQDLRELQSALSEGIPVAFAMPVDNAYEAYFGGVYEGRTGPTLGNHAQLIVGYSGDVFFVCNSWGARWGESGFSRIHKDFILSPECFDFFGLTIAPESLS